ncbi:MAG: thioredoxin-disulfide reductase [Thermotogota bacterium]
MFFDMGTSNKKQEIQDNYDVIIIGGGPAGISAAIYAVQGGLKPLIIEKTIEGGQMNLTELVENYPGFISIEGSEIGEKMGEHAKHYGVDFHFASVTTIENKEESKVVKTDDGKVINTKIIIISTGANPRPLGAVGEKDFTGKGISYCATCDGHFFKDQKVAVIGGGNTALEESLYLAKIAKEVVIIHRRDKLRADKLYQERAMALDNVNFKFDSEVVAFKGDKKLKSLTILDKKDNKTYEEEFDGAFVFIGLVPATSFLGDMLETNPRGYIETDKNMETSVKGIYAVGDVRNTILRQIVTAVSDGAIAASHAVREYF